MKKMYVCARVCMYVFVYTYMCTHAGVLLHTCKAGSHRETNIVLTACCLYEEVKGISSHQSSQALLWTGIAYVHL